MTTPRAKTEPDTIAASRGDANVPRASLPSEPIREARAADLPRANELTETTRQTRGETPVPRATFRTTPKAKTLAADLLTIRTLGELLDDLELTRIANGNRIGAIERQTMDESLPELIVIQQGLLNVEHHAELQLVRAWRKHSLATWAKSYRGLGEKSIARLIAIIGDPAERENVAKLWAYCGHGDPARIPLRKGMTQAELMKRGNPRAKKQVWLIATSMLKAGNRDVYDAARAKYADALHEKPCHRCGPSGHPAAAGSPLSDGHKHARALRASGKAFLVDLWVASRQHSSDAQTSHAGGEA